MTSSYRILNDPKSSDTQIEAEIERIASGLFSVVVTMGQVPYIRCPRNNAAEMIAKRLDAKIRDAIVTSSRSASTHANLFASDAFGYASLQRPRMSYSPSQE